MALTTSNKFNNKSWTDLYIHIRDITHETFEIDYRNFIDLFNTTKYIEAPEFIRDAFTDKRLLNKFSYIGNGKKRVVLNAGNVVIKVCPEIPISRDFNTKKCQEEQDRECIYSKKYFFAFAKTFRVILYDKAIIGNNIFITRTHINIQEKLVDTFDDIPLDEVLSEFNLYNKDKTRKMAKNDTFSWGLTLPLNNYYTDDKESYLVAFDFD